LLRLGVTPMSIFGPHEWFHDDAQTLLKSTAVTDMWAGAYLLLGAPWSQEPADPMDDTPTKSPTKADPMDASPTKNSPKKGNNAKPKSSNLKSKPGSKKVAPVTTVEVDKGVSFTGVKPRSNFISRGHRKAAPIKVKHKADIRTHQDVCYTVELSAIDSDWKEAGAELTAHFV
jgi:hypothetical protein